MVWYQDDIPHPQLPPATNYGWKEEGDGLVPLPVPTRDPQLQPQLLTSSNVGATRLVAGPTVPVGPSASTALRCACVELMRRSAVTSARH